MAFWQIEDFGIKSLWEKTKGEEIKVAILDTGIMKLHPDINANNIILTKNFLDQGDDQSLSEDVTDTVGHGTHCAGIVAAQGIKAEGVAPNVKLMIGKVVDSDMGVDQDALFNGIEWAFKNDADVISVSITLDKMKKEYQDSILSLSAQYKGILLGSLSDDGDLGFDIDLFPFKLKSCLAIGGINENFKIADFTSRSSFLDILAPGKDIYSTWINGTYKLESGCSMATPFVAGVISLFLSYAKKISKNYTKEDVIKLLKLSTEKFASYKTQPDKKYPIVNPVNLFNNLNI